MDLYKDLIKENPEYANSVADMMRMIEDAKKIYDDAYKLSTIIISLTSPQAEAEMFEYFFFEDVTDQLTDLKLVGQVKWCNMSVTQTHPQPPRIRDEWRHQNG